MELLVNKYIKWESGKLICTHPSVERVWQTGGDTRAYESDPPEFRTTTHLIMKFGGIQKEFKDEKESFDKAEEYLQSITHKPKE
jgi:hypothetical protein